MNSFFLFSASYIISYGEVREKDHGTYGYFSADSLDVQETKPPWDKKRSDFIIQIKAYLVSDRKGNHMSSIFPH